MICHKSPHPKLSSKASEVQNLSFQMQSLFLNDENGNASRYLISYRFLKRTLPKMYFMCTKRSDQKQGICLYCLSYSSRESHGRFVIFKRYLLATKIMLKLGKWFLSSECWTTKNRKWPYKAWAGHMHLTKAWRSAKNLQKLDHPHRPLVQ